MTWHHISFGEKIRHFIILMVIIVATTVPYLIFGHAHALSKTWDGGCGVDTTWSCANNWSDNIVPVSSDTVTFDGTSTNDSIVDASFAGTVTTLNMNAGYTGTLSLSRSLTVSSNFTQNAGTFTAGSQTVTVGGLIIGGGIFNASSGITSNSGGLTITAGTFNANGGTYNINGTTGNTQSCNNVTFNLVTFTHTAGTKTVSSNCSMPLGSNPTAGNSGGITLNGTFSGSGTLTGGAAALFTLGTGSSLSGFTGLTTGNGGLTVNGAYNFGSYTTFSVGAFTVSSGATFTAPSGTASFAGGFALNSGSTFNANSGTVNFNGTGGNASLSCNNVTFNLVTFTHNTSATKTVGSNCTLPLGSNPSAGSSGGAITLNGTLSGTGTLTTFGTLTLNSGGSLSGFTGLSAVALTVAGAYNFGSYTTFTNTGNFALNSGGNFTAPSGTASFASSFTINSGSTFSANGGTVNFNGTASNTLTCNNNAFNLVTFTHTAGTKTVSSDCSFPLGSNPTATGPITLNGTLSGTNTFTMSSTLTVGAGSSLSGFSGLTVSGSLIVNGTYNFGSYSPFAVTGGFTLNSGGSFTAPSGIADFSNGFTLSSGSTFNANGGTVNFNGTSAGTISCNNASFSLVTFTHTVNVRTVSSNCSLPLGNNPTITGQVTFTGTLSGSGTLTVNNTLRPGVGSSMPGFTGLMGSSVIISGSYDFSAYSLFNIGGFTLNAGASITLPTGVATFRGNFTLNAASTFNANGGTVNFAGNGTVSCANKSFNLVTFNITGTTGVDNTCNLPLGNDPHMGATGGNFTLSGTLSGSGTLHFQDLPSDSGGFPRLDTGYSLSGFTGLITGTSLVINTTGVADFSSYTTLIVGSKNLTNSSVFGGNFAIQNSGTFIAPSSTTMKVTGSFSITNGGVFNANGGTVELSLGFASTTSGNPQIIGNNTFHNLIVTPRVKNTFDFTAGSTQTVTGMLSMNGFSGNLLTLKSLTPGSPWYIDAQGSTNVGYVNVSESHVLGAAITTCNSTDSGGNSGWIFNPAACNPAHGSDAATAVSNYEALQALLTSQSDQDQGGPPNTASGSGLASKLNEFVKQFPAGKSLLKAAGQFLRVLLGLFIFGLLFVGFLFLLGWRRRREEDKAAAEIEPAIIAPTIIRPPSGAVMPGNTIAPTPLVPKDTIPFNIHPAGHGGPGTGGHAS